MAILPPGWTHDSRDSPEPKLDLRPLMSLTLFRDALKILRDILDGLTRPVAGS